MMTRKLKGVEVEAVQVLRPYRDIVAAFPRSHRHDKPSGALDYIRLVDAETGHNLAREGDWIVKHADGTIEVVSPTAFKATK